MAGRRRDVIFRTEPPMPQHDAENVCAGLQQLRDIVAHIEHARAQRERLVVVVVRVAGVQHALPHLGAVHIQFPVTQPRHVDSRPPHRPVHGELPSQQRRRNRPVGRADPATLPIARLQQPHAESGRRTIGADPSFPVPHPHRPPAAFIALQLRAIVFDVRHFCRCDLAAVPSVTDPGQQIGLAAGDQDLVGRLALAALLRAQQPTEARLTGVDAHRIDGIFAL